MPRNDEVFSEMGRRGGKYNAGGRRSRSIILALTRSPDEAQRNPGVCARGTVPDFAALHPGYNSAYLAAGCACAPGPRIRASNSAVGQESAGNPYFTCIAFTAVRLN